MLTSLLLSRLSCLAPAPQRPHASLAALCNVTSHLFDQLIEMDSNEANGHTETAPRFRRILRLLTAIRHELLCPAAQFLRSLNTTRQELELSTHRLSSRVRVQG